MLVLVPIIASFRCHQRLVAWPTAAKSFTKIFLDFLIVWETSGVKPRGAERASLRGHSAADCRDSSHVGAQPGQMAGCLFNYLFLGLIMNHLFLLLLGVTGEVHGHQSFNLALDFRNDLLFTYYNELKVTGTLFF
jgi:hypothetical protein